MDDYIKRIASEQLISTNLRQCNHRSDDWASLKTVCIVTGLAGSGKTTLLLDYFKNRKTFYFSFAGLEETVAEELFTKRVSEKTGVNLSGWNDALLTVAKNYRIIIFDDISSISTYKRFQKSFYENVNTDINSRTFVVFIAQPTDDFVGLADKYVSINVDYFSITDIIKLYPKLSKFDALGLCAVSGGIPKILNEYDSEKSFEENLRKMLNPSYGFCSFMPEMLSKYFRRPENYHLILRAIASGNQRISEIGRFIGFAYNKCDNYLSALISYGFVKEEEVVSKSGVKKAAYALTNNYFRIWYLYIYKNRTELQLGNHTLKESIITSIVEKEIHEFHLQKAFAFANEQIILNLWSSFRISDKVNYCPQTIRKGGFNYTFDGIARNGDKAVFIKVFENPLESCKRDELDRIRKAVMLTNKYYDSHIFIFSKRRFSDYAVAEAANDDCISLVEVERLRG